MARKPNTHGPDLFRRSIPQMPEGYYSGDKPNPNLRAFVEGHTQRGPRSGIDDDYERKPLLVSSKVKRSTKLFNMHTYWSKKPHESVEAFISHYTNEGNLVLDPYCGSGGTVLMAVTGGRDAIGIDLSPSAVFFSSVTCNPPTPRQFSSAFNHILESLRVKYKWLYEYPSQGKMWPIHFGISSMRFRCIKCLSIASLYQCKHDEEGAACPTCNEQIKTNQQKLGYQLDEWHLQKNRGDHHIVSISGQVSKFEAEIQAKIEDELKSHIPPAHRFPATGRTQVLAVRGIKTFNDLYTPRNLLALTLFRDECLNIEDDRLRQALLYCLTACCLKTSRMMGYNSDGIGRIQKNGLIAQLIVKDVNVFDFLEIAHKGIAEGFDDIIQRQSGYGKAILSTQSACDLSEIPSSSIDYIFTDPPYGYRVQFWESNQVWEAWLGLNTNWQDDEVIVNPVRGLDEKHWERLFRRSMQECFRVLKAGRWITLTYNDRDTWPLFQNVMLETGFLPDESKAAVGMETTAKSEKQLKGEDNTLRDLVVNFRKPKPDEVSATVAITGDEDETTFNEKVHQIIRDYIGANPGSTKDRIYDEVVSRMIRSGQMEAHDFGELLRQVAEEAKVEREKGQGGRWYLKESELAVADAAETAREDTAAEKIGAFIKGHLKKHPGDEGVHYSDLFEHYIYAVKDKPRRQLAECLPDYFYKTEQGTWRLPSSEEEEHAKREARVKGLGRRVKRYIAQLEQGAVIPENERPSDATLAEWIRHCKRAGLYEQGKLLYEKGGLNPDNLTEEAMVNVEEDYQVCARMLARDEGKGQRAKGKGESVKIRQGKSERAKDNG